jgi:hypothetical protein
MHTTKNIGTPSWRGRNVSEAVAIQKKLSFSMDCRALRARNDEKNGVLAMKNSPSWRDRNVSEAVAIHGCHAPTVLAAMTKNVCLWTKTGITGISCFFQ